MSSSWSLLAYVSSLHEHLLEAFPSLSSSASLPISDELCSRTSECLHLWYPVVNEIHHTPHLSSLIQMFNQEPLNTQERYTDLTASWMCFWSCESSILASFCAFPCCSKWRCGHCHKLYFSALQQALVMILQTWITCTWNRMVSTGLLQSETWVWGMRSRQTLLCSHKEAPLKVTVG